MNLEAWSDRVNPIVVKELRQGLRTRVFWVFFGLMLAVCLVIALIAYGTTREFHYESSGKVYFYAFFFPLAVVCFFILPYSAYRSLAREREDETWVLLTLTGLSSRKVIRGKLASFLIQAGLYGSAAGPFMLFSYYLNGIDLPTILGTVLIAAVYLVLLTTVSLAAATGQESRVLRASRHFALLGLLLFATLMGVGAAGSTVMGSGLTVADPEAWGVLGFGLFAMLSSAGVLFEGAAARLALPTENYAIGPRVAVAIQLGGALAGLALLGGAHSFSPSDLRVLVVLCALYLSVVGLVLASDLDGGRRRPARAFSLLRPGALPGLRFFGVLVVGSTAFWAVMMRFSLLARPLGYAGVSSASSAAWWEGMTAVASAPAFAVLYVALPVWIGRSSRSPVLSSPAGVRALGALIAMLGAGLPPLIGLLTGAGTDHSTLNFFNPIIRLSRAGTAADGWTGTAVLWATALAVAFAADRVLARREHRPRAAAGG